jgi:peptide/nickel transport system ATP-binding protein
VNPPVLSIRNLSAGFNIKDGRVIAVDDVSLDVNAGETLAIVGESGSGKSVLALSIMRLLAAPTGKIFGGSILYDGEDIVGLSDSRMRTLRGNKISMVFQEPMTSLNPVRSIGSQIAEVLIEHENLSRRAALARSAELLDMVRVPDAKRRIRQYPHELSGGMRQRVMIAIALACRPRVLIADEPTTALDVTVQAEILALILEMQEQTNCALLLITHDMGVVAETAERVVVMYAGRAVEIASTEALFANPRHPYTRGLMKSMPSRTLAETGGKRTRLVEIPGMVPGPDYDRAGCLFAPRCPHAIDRCRAERPPLMPFPGNHFAACWNSGILPDFVANA